MVIFEDDLPLMILKDLEKDFKSLSFNYLKRDYKNKNVFEFFFFGNFEGSVLFDFNKLNDDYYTTIKNSILACIKRIQLEEKEDTEEESKLKKLWKK